MDDYILTAATRTN